MADCGHSCLKYTLFAFNFLFWILGIVVLGVGIYSRINSDNYDSLLGDGGVSSAANILIAAGIFVAIIGFVGCCGAMKQNKVMLIIYFILVLLIFILEIVAGALAYTKKDLMEEHLSKNLKKVVDTSYGTANPDTATKAMIKAIDWFQKEVKCCGATGYEEWKTSNWGKQQANNTLAPESCCKVKADKCNTDKTDIYTVGCIDAGKQFVKDHMWQVGGVGVGIAVVQVFVMVAAILLCRNISKEGNLA
jgi:CD151 antigen